MFSKRFLLVFAVVLLITSEFTAKASNDESALGVGRFINRRPKQWGPAYPNPPFPPQGGYGLPRPVPCCANQAETTANKQANEAQTHN